jgi:two-component system response regulator BaeR
MLVLVVEDEADVCTMERMYLERAGYTVVEAVDCTGAIYQWRQHQPDLIVLDLNLPDGDGITVCEDIRHYSDVPVLITTARTEEIDELQGLRNGADDYLKKPFSAEMLLARVESVLRRNRKSSLRFGNLNIDPVRQQVYENGTAVHLSSLQFTLLFLLASQPHRVFSRQDILAHLQLDGEVYDRTVDTHIKSLRQRLSNKEYIRTVYGSGYAFQPAA